MYLADELTRSQVSQAMVSPARIFENPADVVLSPSIDRQEKIDILQRWKYDIREMQVAEELGMLAQASDCDLGDILIALRHLGCQSDPSHPTTTF